MARAKLVIASDGVMSAADNIKSGENGFIYSKFDAMKLSDLLETLLKDKQQIIVIGKKALDVHKTFKVDYYQLIINSMLKGKDN